MIYCEACDNALFNVLHSHYRPIVISDVVLETSNLSLVSICLETAPF